MAKKRTYISFDWALKKMLRHKANFVILEGFLSELLKEDIKIKAILDAEANSDKENSKINRVDLFVEDVDGKNIIIEVQYSREIDYFHRMLFATSKSTTEHIEKGYEYATIRKTYSINLLYFDLGQGEDYIYHGRTEFIGMHQNDVLGLSEAQKKEFLSDKVFDLFPEYYVIKINNFDGIAKDTLDEWIYFLKNSEVPKGYSAKGLKEVEEKMGIEKLTEKERKAYEKHQMDLESEKNVLKTARIEGEQIGLLKGKIETACKMLKIGLDVDIVANVTGLTVEDIASLKCD